MSSYSEGCSCNGNAGAGLQYALGAAQGLAYLHEKNIVHSDIKADNVLLADGDIPKICDFAFSKLRAFGQDETSGETPGFAPPEGAGEQSGDVFSFGVFLFELLASLRPLPINPHYHAPQRQCTQIPENVLSAEFVDRQHPWVSSFEFRNTEVPLSIWFGAASEPLLAVLRVLARDCTEWDDPSKRPTMVEVAKRLAKLRRDEIHQNHCALVARGAPVQRALATATEPCEQRVDTRPVVTPERVRDHRTPARESAAQHEPEPQPEEPEPEPEPEVKPVAARPIVIPSITQVQPYQALRGERLLRLQQQEMSQATSRRHPQAQKREEQASRADELEELYHRSHTGRHL
jgi:serine/threonine protein kinase